MKDISELYDKKPSSPAPKKAEAKAEGSQGEKKIEVPLIETPPGLPQEYIDKVLVDEAGIPSVPTIQEESLRSATPPLNMKTTAKPTLAHVETIPYAPGSNSRLVEERIAQGPRVFRSEAERINFQKEDDEKEKVIVPDKKGQGKMAHPDTSKAGRVIRGEPMSDYRPGV